MTKQTTIVVNGALRVKVDERQYTVQIKAGRFHWWFSTNNLKLDPFLDKMFRPVLGETANFLNS